VLGKAEEARPLIDRLVAALPTDLSALLLEVCLASDERRAQASLAHLEHWLSWGRSQNPPAHVPAQLYLAQQSLLHQLRKGTEAAQAGEKAKLADLSQRHGALSLIEFAVKTGRRDLAIELLRKAGEKAVLPEEKRQIARWAHGLGDHTLVGQILETSTGADAELSVLAAEHEFFMGQPQAVSSLHGVLASNKDPQVRARIWPMLIEALMRDGKAAEARAEAEKMQQASPSADAVLLLAKLDLMQDQAQAALVRLEPLMAHAQPSLDVRQVVVMAQLMLGQRDQARKVLDTVLREHPSHPHAARLRVSIEVDDKRLAEAVRVAEDLVARAPRDADLRLLLADVAGKARGPEGAVAVLEAAHKDLPDAMMITAALATGWSKQGKTARAAELYEGVLKEAQGDPVALNNLAVLYVDELSNVERGVELASLARQLSSAPGIVDTLGWALFKRGKPGDLNQAKQLLESVQDKLTSPTSKYHLGAVLIASGDAEQGKRLLTQALAQSNDFAEAAEARRLLATKH
jgi:tetratricopeptide (TPR) repeat protein